MEVEVLKYHSLHFITGIHKETTLYSVLSYAPFNHNPQLQIESVTELLFYPLIKFIPHPGISASFESQFVALVFIPKSDFLCELHM